MLRKNETFINLLIILFNYYINCSIIIKIGFCTYYLKERLKLGWRLLQKQPPSFKRDDLYRRRN